MKKPDGGKVLVSGTAQISVNGKGLGTVNLNGNRVVILITDEGQLKTITKQIRFNRKFIAELGRVSGMLDRFGIWLQVGDSGGAFMELGRGAYLPVMKVRVKLTRLMDLFL
ncbi:MAG: hypothetical protein ACP5NC_02630 [Nitrososphaeria archaeon]